MPRPAKGARLYAQPATRDPATGEVLEPAVWVIRDGSLKRRTGVRVADDRRPSHEAEQALAAYIASKHRPPREGPRSIAAIPVADVINIYLKDKASKQARPKEVASRGKALLAYWGRKMLSEVTGETCRAYAAQGGTRRQLEDLRAAIEYHLEEGLHREIVKVVLPPKGESRERWLTRSEAAKLIWTAYRYKEVQKGIQTKRHARRHVARFMLVALYTGTRAGAICAASFGPEEGRGWVNLETGVFYRRPAGERETNKRKAPVRLPARLLAHMRRWKAKGICHHHPVEWNKRPVKDVDKAFRANRIEAGLGDDVVPHVLKHTSVTWAMHAGVSKEDAASFFSTTVETIERTYWHHHPDFQKDAAERIGRSPGQKPDRKDRNKREQTPESGSNVIELKSA